MCKVCSVTTVTCSMEESEGGGVIMCSW